jgi:catechol 2,3-dioxygenase-like lactoylglutathione lyase family enzyme
MEVLSSRVLLAPQDLERSVRWYVDTLGLRIAREFGVDGRRTGVVLFLGGGFLELSGAARPAGGADASATPVALWLQVPDVDEEHARLHRAGAVASAPETMPWGLRELWLRDPDGHRIVLVEVPEDHPLRRRL